MTTTPTTTGWLGAELPSRPDWLLPLEPQWQSELEAATRGVAHLDDNVISPDTFRLPALGNVLTAVRNSLESATGATLIRGLKTDHLDESDARRMFLGLTSHLGTAVSQSAAGDRVFSVRDAGLDAGDSRVRGPNTNRKLSFHTDRCDVIAFLCLQQAKSGGENQLVSSIALHDEIRRRRPDLLEVLRQPFLYKRHNVDTANALAFCRQPVFSSCDGHFACAFLRVLIDRAYADESTPEMTPQQAEALDFFEAVAAEPAMQFQFQMQPGDILLLNNWITLHRRTAFEDWPEPERRRHILRIWLSVPNSRPLDPAFKANYGAVEAGAIRGGMPADTA